jgi:beta-glucosidase-like glycosyl hydrolase/CubicO group peptidase (beta-lactamase class C family)
MTQIKQYLICIIMLMITGRLSGQADPAQIWADSVYQSMSEAQRIGQLFMIRAHSDLGADHIASVKDQIIRYHVGGLCFFQGTPKGHAALINAYQVLSDLPLLVAMDAEWGGGMRFKDQGFSFPRQLMLGAVQDNRLIYEMGKSVGRQLKEVGIHMNFAPVVDINNNPANPVIGDRSFGEDKYNVTAKSFQYIKGLEDSGVLSCAKHFPGHGDTDTDSHLDLPVIRHSRARLDSVELYPFRVLIEKGLPAVMIAHLQIPALDSTPNLPTTLSRPVVTDLLRRDLGFEGLIMTDALEMKGVTKHYAPGEVELKALLAGNDMLVLPENIHAAIDTLTRALRTNRLTQSELEEHVKRILWSKYNLGLTDVRNVITPLDRVHDQVNDIGAQIVKRALIENAITVVSNKENLIPIQTLDNLSVGTLMLGTSKTGIFEERVDAYIEAEHFAVQFGSISKGGNALIKKLKDKDLVIVGIRGLSRKANESFGVSEALVDFLEHLSSETKVIVVVFGSPYALKYFDQLPNIIVAYEDDPLIQDLVVQGIFGAFAMHGKLPVGAGDQYKPGFGLNTRSLMRFGYTIPEAVGISSDSLIGIERVVEEMIKDKAAPGCQVFVAKDGKVVYERAFGHFTYTEKREVQTSDLYDLASVTKIAASTTSLMRLVDQKKISLDSTMGNYIPEIRGTNKAPLPITFVLAHVSGLEAWIPFYKETVEKTRRDVKPLSEVYRRDANAEYCIPVADDLFMCTSYIDTIWQRIYTSEVKPPGKYVYSDLGFFMFARMIKDVTGLTVDAYALQNFYRPLGLSRLRYNPKEVFPVSDIAPTEEDQYFRGQRIQGYVHDMGAAMLGGVSGHAGLFGNAHSLGTLMQMLMNGGYYGGIQYLSSEVIASFATRVNGSTRRGLGFDMKELDSSRTVLTSPLASDATYGHTGFTGTCAWNDPESGLVYVFLSNRTYPTMNETKFAKGEYRQRVHTAIYNAMGK